VRVYDGSLWRETEIQRRLHAIPAAHQLDTRLGGLHQAMIGGEIVERHAARGESHLELFPRIACLLKAERRSTAATALISSSTMKPVSPSSMISATVSAGCRQ